MNELLHYSSLYEHDYSTGTIPETHSDVEQTKPYDVSFHGTVYPSWAVEESRILIRGGSLNYFKTNFPLKERENFSRLPRGYAIGA